MIGSDRNDVHEAETPLRTLPPCSCHLQKAAAKNGDHNCIVNLMIMMMVVMLMLTTTMMVERLMCFRMLSSLTEAIDIAQKCVEWHGLDRLNLESVDTTENRSLNFTMERFLLDITASSTLCALNNSGKKLPYPYNYSEEYVSRTVGRSYPSHIGCGLEVLLPWCMEHKLSGVKSFLRQVSPKVHPQYCSTK